MAVKNPELLPLFDEAKQLLEPYAKHFSVTVDEPGRYELWSERNVALKGHREHRAFFASLVVQKSYVGLYYMPVYTDPEIKQDLGPELLKLLKGKSCFYLKKLDPLLCSQLEDALKRGLDLYRDKGWV